MKITNKSSALASLLLISMTASTFAAKPGTPEFMRLKRKKAQDKVEALLPKNYESLSACEKQDILWEHIEKTTHKKKPKFAKMGLPQLVAMSLQSMSTKEGRVSDIAPHGWKKYLHRRGAVSKIKIIPSEENKYSGIFKGAECALLRLSLTYRPHGDKPVAPGLALKVLRDETPSANVSALYTLDGQEKDYNFFSNPLSNIVPIGTSFALKIVHSIFSRVTDYPEQLGVTDMAMIDVSGSKQETTVSPRQLFFVPNPEIAKLFSSKSHDVRDDFLKIPTGTHLYKIYAVNDNLKSFNYFEYTKEDIRKFLGSSTHIGDIVTTSKFTLSEFGDTRLFFKHQVIDNNY